MQPLAVWQTLQPKLLASMRFLLASLRAAQQRPVLLARVGYLLILAIATLSSLDLQLNLSAAAHRLQAAFQPQFSARDAVDAVRNLVLFAGWGVVWMLTVKQINRRQILLATATGLALSLSIECTQLFSPVRNSNVVDLLTNSLGALIGAGCIWLSVVYLKKEQQREQILLVPVGLLASSLLAGLVFEAILPYGRSQALDGVYGGPISRATAAWEQLAVQAPEFYLLPMLFFMITSLLMALSLRSLDIESKKAFKLLAVFIAGLAIACEFFRAFLGMALNPAAILPNLLGGIAAAYLCLMVLTLDPHRVWSKQAIDAAFASYAFILMLWVLQPYELITSSSELWGEFSWRRLIPLSAHSWRIDLFSVADIVSAFFLFLPLGAYLAYRSGAKLWFGIAFSASLELAQCFIAGRYFDMTDILVPAASIVVGWRLIKLGTFPPALQPAMDTETPKHA